MEEAKMRSEFLRPGSPRRNKSLLGPGSSRSPKRLYCGAKQSVQLSLPVSDGVIGQYTLAPFSAYINAASDQQGLTAARRICH